MLKNWKFWLGIGISVAALYLTLRNVPFNAFMLALSSAQVIWFLPAFVIFMIGLVIRAYRWATLMGGTPFGVTFHAMNIGYMLNMILPFRVGEIARAFVIGQRTTVTTATALSSIVVERLLDLIAVVLMFFGFAQFIPMDPTLARAASISAVLVVLLVIALAGVIWQADRFEVILAAVLRRFPNVQADAWLQRYRDFAAGFRLINTPRRALIVLVTTVGIWVAALGLAYCMMAAFLPPRFDQAGLMLVAANLGGAAPSAPGGLGPVQFFAKTALVLPFGLEEARATAMVFVWSLSQQLTLIVLGIIGMFRIGLSFSQLRATQAPSPAV